MRNIHKVRCWLAMGSELKNESFPPTNESQQDDGIYAQQTIMISCVMGEMRVKIIIHLHLPNDSFTKDEQKIKNHKKKSAKNEKMRRWNVGRREKWNCHLSIIIISIISIILWRSWMRFACERVSARYNKIMKEIPLGGHWTSFRIVQ